MDAGGGPLPVPLPVFLALAVRPCGPGQCDLNRTPGQQAQQPLETDHGTRLFVSAVSDLGPQDRRAIDG